MIFFLYGDDTFRSLAKKRELLKGFQEKRDPSGLNVAVFDCQKEKEGRIFEEIGSAPFLAEKRMVVLENLLAGKKNTLHSNFLDFIKDQKLPETTILVIWDEGKSFKSDAGKLFDLLKEEKYAQEFAPLRGKDLEKWILQELQSRGANIEPSALQEIVANAEEDSWSTYMLLGQLVGYAGNEAISLKHVSAFLKSAVDDNIFNLIDAIVAKNSRKVFSMIEEQYRNGEDAQYIFAMILRQFRILLELSDIQKRQIREPEGLLAKKLGIHPFVIKKTMPLIRNYSFGQLKDIYKELLIIDNKTKTGQADQSMMIDFFVGKLCLS